MEEGECSGSSRLAESKEEPESLEFCLTEWERGGMKGGGLEEVGGAGGRGFIAAAGERGGEVVKKEKC